MVMSWRVPAKCLAFGGAVAWIGAHAAAAPVTLVNPSFEAVNLPTGTFTTLTPSGWSGSGFGTLDRNSGSLATAIDPTPHADSEQLAWSNAGHMFQVTTIDVVPNAVYTLTVDAGDRTDTNFGGLILRVGVGNTYNANQLPGSLTSAVTPNNTNASTTDGWRTWSATFTTGNTLAATGKLRIEIIASAQQTLIDNVRFDAPAPIVIPTPAALPAGLIFMAGLMGGRAKERSTK